MTAPNSTISPTDTTRKAKLSPTQVAAAALAAVTTAVLGAQLGAAGTVIGAAGASVITTVGTAVYHASLERSRARVRSLAQRTRALPPSRRASGTDGSYSAAANARLEPDEVKSTRSEPQSGTLSRRLTAVRWGAVVVAAVGAFGLAMLTITGIELASGQSVGGNGKGTTLGNVVQAPTNPRNLDPATRPAPPSSSAPASEAPSETSEAPDTTTTTTPDDGTSVEQSPSSTSTSTSDRPPPSTERPAPPPLVPTGIPGVGG